MLAWADKTDGCDLTACKMLYKAFFWLKALKFGLDLTIKMLSFSIGVGLKFSKKLEMGLEDVL